MNVIELENVTHSYEGKFRSGAVLENVNLKLENNMYSIMGPSGSGKSTLLNIIGGILKPTSGRVKILGKELNSMSNKKITDFRLKHVGYIFQKLNLVPFLTVEENILLPLR